MNYNILRTKLLIGLLQLNEPSIALTKDTGLTHATHIKMGFYVSRTRDMQTLLFIKGDPLDKKDRCAICLKYLISGYN